MKNDNVYIENIFDSIQKIEEFVKGASKMDFQNNHMMQSATILQLGLIGEEANKISAETKSKIDLAWKEITGFRNDVLEPPSLYIAPNGTWNDMHHVHLCAPARNRT